MVKNLRSVSERLARIPGRVHEAVDRELRVQVEELVQAIQRAAPVSDEKSDKNPGKLRASVHAEHNPKRELGLIVKADAKDTRGHFIGKHVEHGHRQKNGDHVQARPFFFPTYRARKKRIKAALRRAAKRAFTTG